MIGLALGLGGLMTGKRSNKDYPTAFFNGMDFRLATYTGGPTYAPDHLGVLRSPGGNLPAVRGIRLDGTTYVNTDESGNPIVPSTPQKTVTYNTDWTAKTFAETFDKFDISDPLKAPGWLCEPARTNKCTCRKANPINTTGIFIGLGSPVISLSSNNESMINAAGLQSTCTSGKLYKIAGVNGDVVGVDGYTGNSNPHSMSAYIAVIYGTVEFRLNSIPYDTLTSMPLQKVFVHNIISPLTSTSRVSFKITSTSAEFYFILPDLQEGAFCTSPICKAADGSDPLASLTRAATIASFPTTGKIPVNNFAIRTIVVPRASGQTGYLWGSYVDASNDIGIVVAADNSVRFRKKISGVNIDTLVESIVVKDSPIDLLCVHSASLGMQVSARRYSSSWGAFTDGTIDSTTAAKTNAPIASTYQLGALNSAGQYTGNISLFDCVPIPSGIVDPLSWAKTHWGVA